MAKAASPVRLQRDLMDSATVAAERMHRSAAEQVEYWASIGRSVAGMIDPDSLLAVTTGLARLNVEPISAPAVEPDAVFGALERDRNSGALQTFVATPRVRYQACREHPGLLERIDADGHVAIGSFRDGVFIQSKDTD